MVLVRYDRDFDRKGQLSYDTGSPRQGESHLPRVERKREGVSLRIAFHGDWLKENQRPSLSSLGSDLADAEKAEFVFDGLERWDSTFLVFLGDCLDVCRKEDLPVDWSSVPRGVRKLIDLSRSSVVKEDCDASKVPDNSLLSRIGNWTIGTSSGTLSALSFLGEVLFSFGRWLSGRSRMRWRDLLSSIQDCGVEALPIVTLVSFLTGLTMAFVGGVQLDKFSAQIYVADLVGLAMVREMGALMVAIVMAGRTGAAFAAELGNMKVSEEIDSLRTLGISTFDFLVFPRVLALILMIPLLTLYADVVGILGGMTVGVWVMEFSTQHYIAQTEMAIDNMWEIYSGLIKSLVFGGIIGMVGGFKGMKCGSSSTAVGQAVTSAVVTSITLVVVADALFEVVYSILGWR